MKHAGHYWLACSPRGPFPSPAPAHLSYTPSLLARTVDAWASPRTGVAGMQMRIFELWVGQRPHRCMPFALLLTPGIASRASSLGQAMPRLLYLHAPHVSHSFPDALEAMLESTIEANLRRLLLHRSDGNQLANALNTYLGSKTKTRHPGVPTRLPSSRIQHRRVLASCLNKA